MEELVKDSNAKISDIVTNINKRDFEPPAQLNEAVQFYNNAEYQKALEVLKTIEISPDRFDKNFYIGNCLFKLGNRSEAEMYWLKSVKECVKTPYACVNLGNMYYTDRNFQKALVYWHKALTIEPECENANLNIAIYYSKRDCRDIAIRYYRKYVKYFHSDNNKEDYKKVKEFLHRIDKYCEIYVQKGADAFKERDYNKATEYYLRAIHNDPCEFNVANFLGDMYFNVRNYAKSLEYHLLAYRNDPIHFTSLVNVGMCFDKLELPDYAYCFYKRTAMVTSKLSPGYSRLLEMLRTVAPGVAGNKALFNDHLRAAQDFERDSLYQKAYEEYENAFTIMNSKDEVEILERMKTLKKFLEPELPIIARLMEKIERSFNAEDYTRVVSLCNRVIMLARQNTQEYKEAYSKRVIANKKLDPLSDDTEPD